MALKTQGESSMLSLNPDKADKTGFLHGTRALIKRFRAVLYNYPDKDGVGKTNDDGSEVRAPGFLVDLQVVGGEGKTFTQFYSNGSADQRVPNKAGTAFVRAPGSKVQSALNEGSNAYLLIASLKSCGWPTDQLTGDCSVFEGATVDLIAQPVGGSSSRARAEGERQRTIAVVGKIVFMPDGEAASADEEEEEVPAPKKVAKKAPVVEEDDDEEEAPAPAPKKKAAPPADDDDDEVEPEEEEDEPDTTLTEAAQEYVATVLDNKKYRGKSVDLDTLAKEVLVLARTDKNRKKIIALVQDPGFHADSPWTYNKKTKSITADTE